MKKDSAQALLDALRITRIATTPPPGWHSCEELARAAGRNKVTMQSHLLRAVRNGKLKRVECLVGRHRTWFYGT